MFRNRTLDRLNKMLEEAISGDFQESDYDETKLSRLESKWKQFLGTSKLSRDNLEREKENMKSLISDISHQTKTPMTNIKMYTQLLQENMETNSEEKNKKLLSEIVYQTEKLEFLIQALTKISRLESNIVEVHPEEQNISDLVISAVESVKMKAKNKHIQLILEEYSKDTAYFDMKWTKEALENVLDNAIKYSESGSSIWVMVTIYEMYIAIAVKDQGIGISESECAEIFERFYRGKEVRQKEGVGIGLYLTREILRKENGYVKVKSVPQKGSEFILYLPKRKME